jgi:hypothetical protein
VTTTPAERLGLRAELRVWLGGRNVSVRRAINRWLTGTIRPPTGPLDLAILCPETADEACYFAEKLRPRLTDSASVWIAREPGDAAATEFFTIRLRETLAPSGWSIAAPETLQNVCLTRITPPESPP